MRMSSNAKGLYVARDESDVEEEELETSNASSKSAKPIQDLSVEECLAALRLKGKKSHQISLSLSLSLSSGLQG